MKKYTKVMIIVVLLILILIRIEHLSVIQSFSLLMFLFSALYLFEKREVKRGFQSGIRRLYICVDFDGVKHAIQDLQKNALFRPMTKEAVLTLEKLLSFYAEGEQFIIYGLKNDYYRFWSDQVDFLSGKSHTLSIDPTVYKHLNSLDRERVSASKCFLRDAIAESEKVRSEVSATLLIAELSLLCAKTASEESLKQYYTKVAQNLSKGAFNSVALSEAENHIYLNH